MLHNSIIRTHTQIEITCTQQPVLLSMEPKKTKTVKFFGVKVEVDNSAHNTNPSISFITPKIGSSAGRSRRSGHVRRIENYVQKYEEFSVVHDVDTSMRLSGPGSAITHENKGELLEKRAKKMKFSHQESAKDDMDMSLEMIAWRPSVSRFADESPYFLEISDANDFKISDQGPTKEDMVESRLGKIIVISEKHLYCKTQSQRLYTAAQLTRLKAALQTSNEYLPQAASPSQHFQGTSHSDYSNQGHVPSTGLLQNNNASDVTHQWASEQSLDSNALNTETPTSSESMSQVSQWLGQRQHVVSEWKQSQHSQIQPPEQQLALSILQSPGPLNSSVSSDDRYMVSRSAPLSAEEQQRMQHYDQVLSRGSGVDMVSGVNRSLPMTGPEFQGIASLPMANSGSMGMSSANMRSVVDARRGSSMLRPREALHMMPVPGNSQGVSHFGGLGSPPVLSYPLHHQPSYPISPQPPQVLTPHHLHIEGPTNHAPANPQQQAYAMRLAKERQQRSLQRQQQQFSTSNSLTPQPQLPISSRSPPVSLSPPMQKQQTPTQGAVRNTQSGGSGLTNQTGKQRKRQQKFSQANRQHHPQQRQQVQAKGAKGVGRGNMMINQNVPNDSSLLNGFSTNPGNNFQDKTEPATYLIPNQGLYTAAQPTRQNIGRQSVPSFAVAGPNYQQVPPQQKLGNQNQPALQRVAQPNCQINSDPSTKPQVRDSDTDQHPTSSFTEMDTIATFPQASNNASNAGPVVSQASGHQWTPSEQLLDSNPLNWETPNSSECMPQASQGLGQRPSSASLPSSRHDVSAQWQQNQHSQIQPPEQQRALSIPQLPGLLNSSVSTNGRYMVSRSAPLSVEEQQRMQHYNQILSRGSGVDMVSGVTRSLPMARPGFRRIASSPMVNSRSLGMSSANVHSGLDAGQGSSVLMRPDFQMPGNSQGASRQCFQQQPLQFSTSSSLTPQPQLPISSPMQNRPQSTSLPNQQKPTQVVVRNSQASGGGLTTNQTGKQRKRKQPKQQSSQANRQQDPEDREQPQYIPQYWDSIRKRFVRVQW